MANEEQARNTYPDELIKKCQRVILKRSGKRITKDKAEIYLDKFARLMMVTIKIMEQVEQKKANSSVAPTKL